jgi:hypothetical protein
LTAIGKVETVEKTETSEKEDQEQEQSNGEKKIVKTLGFNEVQTEMKIDAKYLSWGVGETIKVRFLTDQPVQKVEGESKKKTSCWKYEYQVHDLETKTQKTLVLWESHIRKIEPYWKEGKYTLQMKKLEKDISPIIPLN